MVKLGVKKGDVVTLYMPMTPELAMVMLACARIGKLWYVGGSVVDGVVLLVVVVVIITIIILII